MRVLKSFFIAGFLAIAIAGCKSVSTIPVPNGIDNTVAISAKKAPLTKKEKESWGHADLATDSIPGMSMAKAYKFLDGKKGVEVIVGVVDSGTDLKHQDLKDNAWVNKKEIPNNGKDDDKNGYVDDINGWNFLGSIYKENYESDRILMNPKLVDDATYKKIKAEFDKKVSRAKTQKSTFNQMLQAVVFADKTLSGYLKKKNYTKDDVDKIKTDDVKLNNGKIQYNILK